MTEVVSCFSCLFIVTAMTIWDKSNEQKIAPKSRSYIFACKRKQQQQRERKGNKKDIAETRDYSELMRALRI